MCIPAAFKDKFPGAEIQWLVRSDFAPLLNSQIDIDRVVSFDRKAGLWPLLKLAWKLARDEKFTHVYDAHRNVRSSLVMAVFKFSALSHGLAFFRTENPPKLNFLHRSKQRFRRWLFFKWRLPVFPQPYRGSESFLRPMQEWKISDQFPQRPLLTAESALPPVVDEELARLPRPWIAAAPSAAWAMKRWPAEHWQKLSRLMPEHSFIWLGGPEDRFINDLTSARPERAINLAGRLDLAQSMAILNRVDLVIANDTGLLHVADQLERPLLCLIGPTAFGYPSHSTSIVLEVESGLPCKPCSKDGRGKCKNAVYQKCLVDISPEQVAAAADRVLQEFRKPTTTESL